MLYTISWTAACVLRECRNLSCLQNKQKKKKKTNSLGGLFIFVYKAHSTQLDNNLNKIGARERERKKYTARGKREAIGRG